MSETSAQEVVAVTYDSSMSESPSKALNAQDRCDRCGAQAYHRAELEGLELLFCNHHTEQQRAGLEAKGWTISGEVPVPA